MNIALRNVPEDLHAELKAAAKRNHRSLNGEILARLALGQRLRLGGVVVDSEQTAPLGDEDREALLERIRERQKTIGKIDVSSETIKELKGEGREALLERIRERQKAIGKIDFNPDMIREMRDSRHP